MRRVQLIKSLMLLVFVCLMSIRGALAFDLSVTIDGVTETYTATDLLNFAPAELRTATPWDEEPESAVNYQGVFMANLFTDAKTQPVTIRATALNDYSIEFPYDDAVRAGAFIAVTREGKPMPVRSRGPYWLIFPFYADVQPLPIKVLSPWSIWQMVSLEVVE